MSDIGLSTLLGKTATFIGFGFTEAAPGVWLEITVYEIDDGLVLCMSELRGEPDRAAHRKALAAGAHVRGDDLVPFAKRLVTGAKPVALEAIRAAIAGTQVSMEWREVVSNEGSSHE